MRTTIAIPNYMAKIVKELAEDNDWSLSRTICYLISCGSQKLYEIGLMDRAITFDVDNPSRQARKEKGEF